MMPHITDVEVDPALVRHLQDSQAPQDLPEPQAEASGEPPVPLSKRFQRVFTRPDHMRVPEGVDGEQGLATAFTVAYGLVEQGIYRQLAEPKPEQPPKASWLERLGGLALGLRALTGRKQPVAVDPADGWKARQADAHDKIAALRFLRDQIEGFEYSSADDRQQILTFDIGLGHGAEILVCVASKPGADKCEIKFAPQFYYPDGIDSATYDRLRNRGISTTAMFTVMGEWVSRALTVGHDSNYAPKPVTTSRPPETVGSSSSMGRYARLTGGVPEKRR